MFKTKNTAFLLVIVLAVGGILGYTASHISVQPTLSSQEARIAQLTYAVTVLNSTIGYLQDYVRISNSTINILMETIEGLGALSTVKPGYIRSTLYSLSLQYPQEMNATVTGFIDASADEWSGRVTGTGPGYESFEATWISTFAPPSLEESLDAGMEPLKSYSIELSEKVQSTVQGHQALYQTYRITGESGGFNGALAVWYCDRSQLFVVFSVTTGSPFTVAVLNDYLSGLYCHLP